MNTKNMIERYQEKLNDNTELIKWVNKISKISNIITTVFLTFNLVLTLITYSLFKTNFMSVFIANKILLPIATLGFLCTIGSIGILASTNIIYLANKLGLKLHSKNLTKKISILKSNDFNKNYSETKTAENNLPSSKKTQKTKETIESQYNYQNNKIINGSNFIMINSDSSNEKTTSSNAKTKKRVLSKD